MIRLFPSSGFMPKPWSYPVTTTARDLLATFEKLPPDEKHEVAAEILRRSAANDDLPEGALAALADELFLGYDAKEAARAFR